MPRVFLTAEWRWLAMLNFEADPALLKPHLPRACELDLWQGKTLVSLVGFRFLNTRVMGAAIPFHRNFEEVNLRFYVRGQEGRGVVFIREIVPRRAITAVARTLYGENYVTAPMEHTFATAGQNTHVEYGWRWRGRRNYLAVDAESEPQPMLDGSAQEFIFEHYWGYGKSTYRVDHPRWLVHRVVDSRFDVDADSLYGKGFGEALARPPVSAMLAEGSEISVYRKL